MVEEQRNSIISRWQKNWKISNVTALMMLAFALALFLTALSHAVFTVSFWWIFPVFIGLTFVVFFANASWKISTSDVARYLDSLFPQLEESAELSLKPSENLNLLQKLQKQKVEKILPQLPQPKQFYKQLKTATIILTSSFVISYLISIIPLKFRNTHFIPIKEALSETKSTAKPEVILPEIENINLKITPPGYTRKGTRERQNFTITAEDGAVVNWEISTNKAVKQLSLIFNDHEKLALKAANSDQTEWKIAKTISKSGFYQVDLDGKISDLYQIEVIKDLPPVIKISSPKPSSVIDYGELQKTLIKTALSDDYGIREAYINATIASGTGEAVKFKEQKLNFDASFSGHQTQYQLQKQLDLMALGMQPGDELYFYIKATDNHNQQTRSEVYIVSIADTAKLMQMSGVVNALDVKPELFRSERQIIIETEQLLKAKDTISATAYKIKCNDLGIDQKLLRLRYGKFLGEESESGNETEAQQSLSDPKDFNNTAKIMDAYTDKHDNAEDATFLEPETKKQLKATLNEMWSAELRLRTFKPQEALPFAYKALRLLKNLQEKSRAYVAKTSIKTTPLKPAEKRLTGDLSKIIDPVNARAFKQEADAFTAMRQAATLLYQLKNGSKLSGASLNILRQSNLKLNEKAAAQPSVYLAAVNAFRRIIAQTNQPEKINHHDFLLVEKAIERIIPAYARLPQAAQNEPDMGLSGSYFQNLSRTKK